MNLKLIVLAAVGLTYSAAFSQPCSAEFSVHWENVTNDSWRRLDESTVAAESGPSFARRELIVRGAENTKGGNAASAIVRERLGAAVEQGFVHDFSQKSDQGPTGSEDIYDVAFYSLGLADEVIQSIRVELGPNLAAYVDFEPIRNLMGAQLREKDSCPLAPAECHNRCPGDQSCFDYCLEEEGCLVQ